MKISVESVLNKNHKLLHAYVQCVYIVSAKYQIAQSKAVVGVERPIKALSMHMGMFKNNEAFHFMASYAHVCLDFKDQT